MKVVCVSNVLNNHSKGICDAFYKKYGDDFLFIATKPYGKSGSLKGGDIHSFINSSYWSDGYSNNKKIGIALKECAEADIVLQMAAPDKFVRKRLSEDKITFRVSERFLTGEPKDFLRKIKYFLRYYSVKHNNLYFLASGAYASFDMNNISTFKNKTYKWGYFPIIEEIEEKFDEMEKLKFLWVGRFLEWKQPEKCIKIALFLQKSKIDFEITMVGTGVLLSKMKHLVKKNNLESYFVFPGSVPSNEVQKIMGKSDYFLLTSNKKEGWGVVLNEAMANSCIPIASHEIGSVPFLIKNNENGFVYKGNSIESLENVVKQAINLTDNEKLSMKRKAKETILDEWSAEKAVNNFLQLAEDLKKLRPCSVLYGPASKAEIFDENEYIEKIMNEHGK